MNYDMHILLLILKLVYNKYLHAAELKLFYDVRNLLEPMLI